MFAKKPPLEPTPPSLPPVLHIHGPMDPPELVRPIPPPAPADAPPEPLERISEHPPYHRIAEAIIRQALRERAAEIRITPNETVSIVQYLVAGEWQETMRIPIDILPGLVSAFKTLAGLPIWEHRMKLAGLIPVECALGAYDIQITIIPTRHGEKIAMRIEASTD
jgi:type II secretory ATPase GspE/PulE/Tfp pilus assembly ATPase PilB-like protein